MNDSIFTPALARTLLFIISGFLTARGLPTDVSMIVTEPTVVLAAETVVGVMLGGLTFLFWRLAKRFGWRT